MDHSGRPRLKYIPESQSGWLANSSNSVCPVVLCCHHLRGRGKPVQGSNLLVYMQVHKIMFRYVDQYGCMLVYVLRRHISHLVPPTVHVHVARHLLKSWKCLSRRSEQYNCNMYMYMYMCMYNYDCTCIQCTPFL